MPKKPSADLNTSTPVSLRLPPEIRTQVVKMAAAERRSLSAQLVYLIEAALAKQTSGGEARQVV